jgi:hypothetical protein
MSPLDLTEIAEKLAHDAVQAGANNAIAREQDCGDYPIPEYEEIVEQHAAKIEAAFRAAVVRAFNDAADQLGVVGNVDRFRLDEEVATWLRMRARAAQGDPQETKKSVKT